MHSTVPFAWDIVFLRFALSIFRASALAAAVASGWHLLSFWCGSFHSELQLYFMPIGAVDLERFTARCRLSDFFIRDIWTISQFLLASVLIGYIHTGTNFSALSCCSGGSPRRGPGCHFPPSAVCAAGVDGCYTTWASISPSCCATYLLVDFCIQQPLI